MTVEPRSSKNRILIVDDHAVVRHGLRELLSHEPDLEVCGEAADVQEAQRLVESLSPDMAIVDLSLKDGSGIDLIKRLHAAHPRLRVLVASMHDEGLFAERALSAGAKGYVSKHESVERMVEAIRQVLQGEVYLSPQMTARLLARGTVPAASVTPQSPVSRLSDREIEVFEAIGRGRTTREIAETLFLSIKTIETHRENIKRKLGLANNTELIRHACRWCLEES
jgi:DNA-binding NarL/FixJ family response regulator